MGGKLKQKAESGRNHRHASEKEIERGTAGQWKFYTNKQGGVVLNNDNDESRKMVEQCYKQSKTVVNPIIDWTDGEVWEFIKEYNIPYCKLYDEGYKRLGCIGCPMGTVEHRKAELERYPKYKQAYIRAFDRMIEQRIGGGYPTEDWTRGQQVMEWYIGKS